VTASDEETEIGIVEAVSDRRNAEVENGHGKSQGGHVEEARSDAEANDGAVILSDDEVGAGSGA